MSQQEAVRVAVFRDAAVARRVIFAAWAEGFDGVHVVSEDSAIQEQLRREIGGDKHLLVRSPGVMGMGLGVVGAGVGLALGLAAALFLAPIIGRDAISNLVLPIAAAIFGGFVGGMLSRALTSEVQDFYDQDLAPDEILIAIEAHSPARLALAEWILSQGSAPAIPLREG